MEEFEIIDKTIYSTDDFRQRLKDIKPRMIFVLVSFGLLAVTTGIIAYYDYQSIQSYVDTFRQSEVFLGEWAQGLYTEPPIIETFRNIDLGMSLLTVVTYCMWKYRAAKNVSELKLDGMRFSPQASIAWYFVPIAWFWKPLQAMNEIWRGSLVISGESDRDFWKKSSANIFIGFWWAIYVSDGFVASIFSEVVGSLDGDEFNPDSLLLVTIVQYFTYFLAIAATIVMIWKVSSKQQLNPKAPIIVEN